MSSELTAEAIAAAGLSDALGDVLAQPHQIADALWRIESAGIPRRELSGGVAVCGPGQGGDLAAAVLGDRATAPVRDVRGFSLEPWTRDDTLVLCASYSGDDEEALACFEDAGARGAPRAVICTAGPLAVRAREEGVPVIGVPAGMAPSAAVVYFTLAALECAALVGAGPSLRAEAEAATAMLGRLADEWRPDQPEPRSLPKLVAPLLRNRIVVVHGAGPTAAVARRWADQIEATAGMLSFWREIPEPDRGDRFAWLGAREAVEKLAAIFLCHPDHDERLQRRFQESERYADVDTASLEPEGDNALERVLSLVLMGDLLAIYLAALNRA
jgi:glucose/mannose-6-phosphate isomerase